MSYDSDELKALHCLPEDIIKVANQKAPELDVDDIIERMFDLADQGERDPDKLREAVLKSAA